MNDEIESKTVSNLADATSVVDSGSDSSAEQPQRKSLFSQEWEPSEDVSDISGYSGMCITAVIALICGAASLLGFVSFPCIIFALFGIVLGLIAYRAVVRSQGTLTGKDLALYGLCFSLISLFGVVSSWSYYQYDLRTEADRFSRIWFEAIKRKDVKTAREMFKATWYRKHKLSENEWWYEGLKESDGPYDDEREMFLASLNDMTWKTLWAVAGEAEITYFKTETFHHSGEKKDGVALIYAVTFHDELGEKKTFFIRVYCERVHNSRDDNQLGWMIVNVKPVGIPVELGGKPPEEKRRRY